MEKRSIKDVMICPYCGSNDCYEFSTDEIYFDFDKKGNYSVDCHCRECKKDFTLVMNFEYNVIKSQSCKWK